MEGLPPIVALRLLRFADPAYRFERCGVVDVNHNVVELANRSFDPASSYRMSTADVRAALAKLALLHPADAGKKRLAMIWHTHIFDDEEQPSDEDIAIMPRKLLGAVVHVPTRTITVYNSTGVVDQYKEDQKQ